MTATVRIRARAQQDLEEAAAWYEAQRSGLGGAFLDEAQAVLDALAENPTAFRELYRATRRAVLRRFPFCIYYKIPCFTYSCVA